MPNDAENHLPVLIVEDDQPTAELEAKVLRRSGRSSLIVPRADEALSALKRERYSSILLDYLLADENGWSVLQAAQEKQPPIPVIVVTGKGNEEVAVEALRLGAADYVIKNGDYWEQLPNIVERVEKTAEAERLRLTLASVVEASDDAIVGSTAQGSIISVNSAAVSVLGWTQADVKGRIVYDLFPPERRHEIARVFERVAGGGRVSNFETVGRCRDGKNIHLSVAFSPISSAAGAITGVSMIARDISERKRAEEKLRRTEYQLRLLQKYEAIRQIAGGVAHEFNNLLTVMIVRSELMKGNLTPENPMWAELDLVVKTGERAATVSRQLLAFSRQQFLRPKVYNLNVALTELQKILRRLLGESISLDLDLAPELGQVRADPVKLDEVVINMAMNAKDAMPDGGKIVLSTANVTVDESQLAGMRSDGHEGFKPGRYVLLSITDTGCGMDQATLSRVFEPFFTTKGRAKRTGLGLAMVYGTIKQSDGYIYASSQPEKGSRFEIYLPSIGSLRTTALSPATFAPKTEAKTILIVEDELYVLDLVTEILSGSGYTLLTANSPLEAIALVEKHSGKIDLLLTDVVMPDMNGPEMAVRIGALKSQMKVLYMSGYPESHLGLCGNAGIEFISKPFSIETLKRKVNELLQEPKA